MERVFCRKNICIAVYSFVFFLVFTLSFGKFGNFIVDTGRELYTPFAMTNFKTALFKDIICIYGPLPYIFNSFFLKIFGSSFALFNFIGGFLAYFFCLFFFLVSNKFLNEINSLLLTFAVLVVSIFNFSPIFNFIVPYSYAMLYAAFFGLVALFFSLKYIETKSPRYFVLTSFFVSLTAFSKFDFAVLFLPLFLLAFCIKPSKSALLKALVGIFLPLLLIVFYLFFNKVSLSDVVQNFHFISKMANAPSLRVFYSFFSGFVPNYKLFKMVFPLILKQSAAVFLPLVFFIAAKIASDNKVLACILRFAACCSALIGFLFLFANADVMVCFFAYLPLFFVLFFTIESFDFLKNKHEISSEIFLYLFTVVFSIKSLFFLRLERYGSFYFPLLLLSLCVVLKKYIKFSGKFYSLLKKYLTAVLIVLIFIFSFLSLKARVFADFTPISTPQGKIYASEIDAKILSSFFSLVEIENPDNEPVLGLPEGLFFNFILKNEYKIYPTSFIPLDFDAYGEDFAIQNVLKANPKIIFFTPRDCTEYGKTLICKDFGQKFCSVILEKYNHRAVVGAKTSPLRFDVYVRKD